jgi:GTP-binding protein Era
MSESKFKSGFVNIIGRPNVGKSTLLNALLGENMVIVSPKPQTTRHRIFGIFSDDQCQIVFSDTPGIIAVPKYKMQERMNAFVEGTFEDADIFLFVINPDEIYEEQDPVFDKFKKSNAPVILIINKMDTSDQATLKKMQTDWMKKYPFNHILFTSALHQFNTENLLNLIKEMIPVGPAYFPDDQLSDRNDRFFASEMIRESILNLYEQEIPYSCEVIIDEFKETQSKKGDLIRILATIYISRESQKPILIGKSGSMIKKLGIAARKRMEEFFQQHIHLELFVKVKENWRDDEQSLRHFGYTNS